MNRLMMFLTALLLTACVKITDENQPADIQPPVSKPMDTQPPADPAPESPAVYFVNPLDEPNRYEVRLLASDSVTMVERISLTDQSRILLPLSFQDGYFIDSRASSGQDYLYRVGRTEKTQYYLEREISVKTPRDLVIQSEVVLIKDEAWTGSSRLFLLAGGFVTTNGYQLSIQTKKLFAMGGVIRTFDSPEGSAFGGRKDGGSIDIQADEATGSFRIELLGKNGKSGWLAEGAMDGTNGEHGGNTGSAILKIKNLSDLEIRPLRMPGAGGRGGDRGMTNNNDGYIPIPIWGHPGYPGRPGLMESFCVENGGVRSCL